MSRSFFSYAGAAVAAYFGYWNVAASLLASGVQSEKQRRARNQARDAANASLQDRMVMLDLQPDAPRTLAMGRVRAVEGVRRRWVSGTNNTTLTLVVSFAGHEIDGFEQFWFNDIPLTLDSNGWVQTEPYLRTDGRTDNLTATADGAGAAAVTLTSTPVSGSTVTAVYTSGTGDAQSQGSCTVTLVAGLNYTVTGAIPGADIQVLWQTSVASSAARIRTYLGTDAQNVGADLAAEYPGHLTATDRFAGIPLAVVDLLFDPDAFPQGVPNITATFRGAKLLDPRTGLTTWSRNPMLQAYHYARWANGWAVPVGEVRTADVSAGADFCDTSTVFTLGVDDVTLPRYQCAIVIGSDADPRAAMGDIMEAMAGKWGWAGGTLRMRCGRMATPVFAMDASWLAQRLDSSGQPDQQSVIRLTNGVPRDSKVNRVTGTCVDPDQRYQVMPFPMVQDTVLIAAEGLEFPQDISLAGVAHIAHAQHLASIIIREQQAALRLDALCTLDAYRCELFDVGTFTMPRYGMTGKTIEVTGWRWHPTEGVNLKLAEISADIFDPVDTLQGRDPAPNGNLPSPWQVAQITGVAVSSAARITPDGAVQTVTTVTWTRPANQAVLAGGRIEVQVTLANDVPATGVDWPSWLEPGGAEQAAIVGLSAGVFYLFRVRAVTNLGVRSRWSAQVLHRVVLDTTPPEDVTNLDWEIKPGLVRITCDPCIAADYAATELRYLNTLPDYDSGDWAAATFLVKGKSNEYHHPRPPNGTYYVLAKHQDNSDNYSTGTAYITVVVDDSIDSGGAVGGRLQLTTDRAPYYAFADATTHTSASPEIAFTCAMLNAAGTVTWTARAFNSSGTDIGAVALTGTGLVRTLSAAQFVAPGSSGSVREVRVSVSHPTAGSDNLQVYRRDTSTTTPQIFLSNRQATVPTDINGLFGDYTDANTQVQVITGLTDETALYTISINPDPGMTATVNGGAGPVTTAIVNVAVTDSTIDDGYVSLSAARSGFPTLTDDFRVSKAKGTDGLRIYWDPRAEIVLPVGSDGTVSTWADAWSTLQIDRQDGFSDVDNWTWSAQFVNCVGTQTRNRVDVTGLLGLGVPDGSATSAGVPAGSGWNQPRAVAYDGTGRWFSTGSTIFAFVAHSKVITSDDYQTWTARDVGATAEWVHLVWVQGAAVLIADANDHRVRRSTDGGVTWVAGGSFASAGQITGAFASDTTVIAASYSGPASQRSTNGGQSWSSLPLPGGVMSLYGCGQNEWLGRDTNGYSWRSTDNGTTWANISSQLPATLWQAKRFKGRTFLSFWGGASTQLGFIQANGPVQFMTLPISTVQASFVVIGDVLYVASGSSWAYTTDGLIWRTSSVASFYGPVYVPLPVQSNYLPILNAPSGQYVRQLLTATSDTDADVILTAVQAGKTAVRRVLPVRKETTQPPLFAFGADPGQINVPATSDGVVTDYGPATCTAIIRRDGVPDATSWTITWTATGMTPSSGTGATATFTGMTAGLARTTLSYLATRSGYDDVRGDVPIVQVRGTQGSGYRQGASFMVIDDQANTYLGLRFTTDGWVQVKRGSGGSWVNYTPWSGAPGTPGIGGGTWMKVIPEVGAPALTSGTINVWLALSSTREYIFENASSGTHIWRASFLFSNSASGSDPLAGSGGLMLIVP